MKTIEDYFTYVRQLMQRVPDVSAERYDEQLLSVHRGNLRIRLRFSNHALLEISEAVVIIAEKLRWLSYRYHYQDPAAGLVFRYDNTYRALDDTWEYLSSGAKITPEQGLLVQLASCYVIETAGKVVDLVHAAVGTTGIRNEYRFQ